MSSAPGASLRRPRASPISPLPLSPNVEVAAWASAVGGDLRRRLLSPQQVEATGTDFVTVSEEVKDPSKHPMRMEQLTQLSATLACPGHLSQRTLRLPRPTCHLSPKHMLCVSCVTCPSTRSALWDVSAALHAHALPPAGRVQGAVSYYKRTATLRSGPRLGGSSPAAHHSSPQPHG